jgi:hypothetical protein
MTQDRHGDEFALQSDDAEGRFGPLHIRACTGSRLPVSEILNGSQVLNIGQAPLAGLMIPAPAHA